MNVFTKINSSISMLKFEQTTKITTSMYNINSKDDVGKRIDNN